MKYLCLVYLEAAKLHAVHDRECKACGDELRQRGVVVAAEALQPVDTATTVRIRGGQLSVTDGPFAETKELIAGFWLWKVNSKQEAIDWLKRAPFDGGTEVELRQILEAEDFEPIMTPELREKEEKLRAQVQK